MHFIRKGGRVIPIRDDHAVAKGAAAGGAAYAVSRIPVKSASKSLEKTRAFARNTEGSGFHFRGVTDFATSTKIGSKMGSAKSFPRHSIKTEKASAASIKRYAGKKFVIKPNEDSTQSMTDFFTEKSKVPKTALKGSHVIQPRLDFTHEYRVTSSAGKVTSITHRRLPGSKAPIGAFIPVVRGRSEIKKFTERALKSGTVHPHKTGILGVDIGRTKAGLKMIEANVGPGDVINPIKNIKAKSYLLGRLPKKAAAGLAVAVGAATYAFSRRRHKNGE